MSCLTEEGGDPLYIMEEMLVTKRAFDCVEWKNFSKLPKDMHCYLTASTLFFQIRKCKKKKTTKKPTSKSFCEMVLFLYHLKHLKILLTLLFQLEIYPGDKWEEIYQKSIDTRNQIYNYKMLKECCSHSNILFWCLKVSLLNLEIFKLTK